MINIGFEKNNLLYKCSSNTNLTNNTMVNIPGLVFTLKANSGYWIVNCHIQAKNALSAGVDIKFDWEVTGSDYTLVSARNCRGGENQPTNSLTLSLTRNSGGHGLSTDVYYPLPAVDANSYINESFIVLAGATNTIFQYRASQVSISAEEPNVVSDYSYIILSKTYLGG